MKIAIAGGGIGGMTLALALVAAGLEDVDVYESAAEIRELGVGINVMPHAVRELTELGLLEGLLRTGVPTADFVYFSKLGQRIWGEPLGVAAGYRWPQISIHRGRLLALLHRALAERLGPDRVHPGQHLVRLAGNGGLSASAEFTDRSAGGPPTRVEADLLVGCDGIHSVVRTHFYPDEGPPRWNGVTMWRGTAAVEPFLSGRTMINAGSTRQRVVVYPISENEDGPCPTLINWVATRRVGDGDSAPPQDWTYVADRDQVVSDYSSFRFDFLDVPALISASEVVYRYPMMDRDPLPTWNFERVTLLGDAAHPMHPVGGNGASQAIIDARTLARELVLQDSVKSAVAAYDAQRRPATSALVQSNRRAGPHRCQDLVEERAPLGFRELSDVITQAELEDIASEYKRVGGFDVETLNSRPSLSPSQPSSAS